MSLKQQRRKLYITGSRVKHPNPKISYISLEKNVFLLMNAFHFGLDYCFVIIEEDHCVLVGKQMHTPLQIASYPSSLEATEAFGKHFSPVPNEIGANVEPRWQLIAVDLDWLLDRLDGKSISEK